MNLYIVDYKPNGECVWIPLDELNNYIDRDNYPDKVSGKRGKMKRYWTESISSFEGRNTTIEPYEDIEVYKADEVDARIQELEEEEANIRTKCPSKCPVQELEEEMEKKLDLIDLLNLEIKALNEQIVALKGLNKSGNMYSEYGNQDKNKLEDSHD